MLTKTGAKDLQREIKRSGVNILIQPGSKDGAAFDQNAGLRCYNAQDPDHNQPDDTTHACQTCVFYKKELYAIGFIVDRGRHHDDGATGVNDQRAWRDQHNSLRHHNLVIR